ncbi:MAG: MlaD family protein [Pseudomonadota bacterium]
MTEAIIVNKKRWRMSPIWFLPFTALLLATWLGYESYIHHGVTVSIRFTTGSGISVNKTKVMYKGIAIGKVVDVEIDKKDIEQVIVTVLLDKRTSPYLLTDTQFWLVKPSVSLGGISGLDTLVSGNYIAMNPGFSGTQKEEYIALKEAPIESDGKSGLHVHIQAKTRGSIVPTSPVYFKKIKVGEVLGSKYRKQSDDITIMLKIDEEYAYLLKKQSRFYNVSGIHISGGLSGIKIQTESLASIVIGGLAFYNPENTYLNEAAVDGDNFPLFDDFESADIGIPIILQLDNAENLQQGDTEIKYLGSKIGFIKKITTDYTTGKITAIAYITPLAEYLLKTGTKIWKVEPVLNINRVTGIETLIKGIYLAIRPGVGEPNSVFQVLEKPPAVDLSEPGLHLSLSAKRLGSLQAGSGVYFKNIQIGSVQSYHLDELDSGLLIQLFIQPEYAHLIHKNSHFYENSGISIKGGLSGLSIKTESLSSIISGGISVYNPESIVVKGSAKKAINGDDFKLYENYEDASSGSEISIYFTDISGIKKDNTRIVYKGVDLGYVFKIKPDKNIGRIKVLAKIDPIARELLKKNTLFWLVKPKITLAGISGLDTIIGGSYITLKPGSGQYSKTFTALDDAPEFITSGKGLKIVVKTRELGSISVGAPVLYHQLPVGSITSYQLDKKGQFILIDLNIQERYRKLVKKHSRFYQASGFSLSGSLSGINFRTESLTSMIKGGIAFITPKINAGRSGNAARVDKKSLFNLFADLQSAQLDRFSISVSFPDADGLKKGAKVKFNGIDVGEVSNLKLHTDLRQVVAELSIDANLRKILGKKSQFKLAKAEFGLAKTQHLGTLLSGTYIILEPVAGKFSSYFRAQEMKALHGLSLFLKTQQLGSIKKGNPVSYRQVKVGRVVDFDLADTADHVLIHIIIEQQYAALVRENSKFWNASGINMNINLFAGSKIKTESLQSILDGGISFSTPGNDELENKSEHEKQPKQQKSKLHLAKKARVNSTFTLYKEVDTKWLEWNPKIQL